MLNPKDNPIRWVGPKWAYKVAGVHELSSLIRCGMKPEYKLLDFGCGSLRLGMYAIQFLDKGNYYGIEPYSKLVDFGIKENNLKQLVVAKHPAFRFTDDCDMTWFCEKFDYIHSQSVFTHLSEADCHKAMKSAARSLKPNGIFLLTIREGKTREVEKWEQKKVVRKSPKWIKAIGEKYGFTVKKRGDIYHWNNQQWYELRKK